MFQTGIAEIRTNPSVTLKMHGTRRWSVCSIEFLQKEAKSVSAPTVATYNP
jgi:hypothetical protein